MTAAGQPALLSLLSRAHLRVAAGISARQGCVAASQPPWRSVLTLSPAPGPLRVEKRRAARPSVCARRWNVSRATPRRPFRNQPRDVGSWDATKVFRSVSRRRHPPAQPLAAGSFARPDAAVLPGRAGCAPGRRCTRRPATTFLPRLGPLRGRERRAPAPSAIYSIGDRRNGRDRR